MNSEELNKRILEKLQDKIAISNFEKEDTKMSKKKLFNIVATFVVCIGITVGMTYAGTKVYEKQKEKIDATVYKTVKEYNSYDEFLEDQKKDVGSTEITKEDLAKVIDIEEAEAKAKDMINTFMKKDVEFVRKDLKKNYVIGAELVYVFSTSKNYNNGIEVQVDATNGNCVGFSNREVNYKEFKSDKISDEDATEKANQICNIFGLNMDEYKLKSIDGSPYFASSKKVCDELWVATYCKTYDGAFNYFERFEIHFIVENGEVIITDMYLGNEDVKFENNEVILDKSEAENIALEENKKITNKEIESVDTELEIRQVNSWILILEQNGGKYPKNKTEVLENGEKVTYPPYKITEKVERKVWTVCIKYKQDENKDFIYSSIKIFVDTTTGEIVGGANESYMDRIK